MSTVKDAKGNILNVRASQLVKYSEDGLTIDWFDKHPRPKSEPVLPSAADLDLTVEEAKIKLATAAPLVKAVIASPAVKAALIAQGASIDLKAVNAALNSNNDVPSVQLPSERSNAGLAGGQAIPEPTSPSGDTKSDVSITPLGVPLY